MADLNDKLNIIQNARDNIKTALFNKRTVSKQRY